MQAPEWLYPLSAYSFYKIKILSCCCNDLSEPAADCESSSCVRAQTTSAALRTISVVKRNFGLPQNRKSPDYRACRKRLLTVHLAEWWQTSVSSRRREDLFATESSLVARAAHSLAGGPGPS